MAKRIAFLSRVPALEQHSKTYGIDYLSQNGFEVVFLDVSYLVDGMKGQNLHPDQASELVEAAASELLLEQTSQAGGTTTATASAAAPNLIDDTNNQEDTSSSSSSSSSTKSQRKNAMGGKRWSASFAGKASFIRPRN